MLEYLPEMGCGRPIDLGSSKAVEQHGQKRLHTGADHHQAKGSETLKTANSWSYSAYANDSNSNLTSGIITGGIAILLLQKGGHFL